MDTTEVLNKNDSNVPASLQLADYFEECIKSKKYKPNEKLPTTNDIVGKFGVSTHTVRKAMNILESKGLVNMTPRRGTYVNYDFPTPSNAGSGHKSRGSELLAGSPQKALAGRTVGAFGLVDHDSALGDWGMFRVDSTRGVLTECDRQGLVLMNLSERRDMDIDQCVEMVKYYKCEGVLWCRQDKFEVVSKLNDAGISSVLVCRDKPMGFKCASVYPDYYDAGVRVASKIYDCCSDPRAIIVHIEYPVPSHGDYAKRFWAGLQAAPDNKPALQLENKTWHIKQFKEILDWLKTMPCDIPVIFMCSYHLIGLIMNYREETEACLANREVFAVSNREPNLQLLAFGNDIDPYIIYDDFSKLTSTGIQKLVTLMGGYLDNTNTTLEMNVSRLSNFSIISNEFFERYK